MFGVIWRVKGLFKICIGIADEVVTLINSYSFDYAAAKREDFLVCVFRAIKTESSIMVCGWIFYGRIRYIDGSVFVIRQFDFSIYIFHISDVLTLHSNVCKGVRTCKLVKIQLNNFRMVIYLFCWFFPLFFFFSSSAIFFSCCCSLPSNVHIYWSAKLSIYSWCTTERFLYFVIGSSSADM